MRLKTVVAMFLLMPSAIAFAEVGVLKKVDNNPVTNEKTESVMLVIGSESADARLTVICRHGEVRGRSYNMVGLALNTPDIVVKSQMSPMTIRGGNSVMTLARFEGRKMESIVWTRSDDPTMLIHMGGGIIGLDSFKFVRDKLFNAVKLHIQLTPTQTVSFDLVGLSEEYAKHGECKEK